MSATLKVANGLSSKTLDSKTLILPIFSVMKILSPTTSIAQGFSRLVARICTFLFSESWRFGGGIGGGSDGDVRITIEVITAAIIPAILNFLSIIEKLFKSY